MYGNGKRQHQDPEHGRRVRSSGLAHSSSAASGHEQDEERAEPDHDVEGVVEELDVVGPLRLRGKSSSPSTLARNVP